MARIAVHLHQLSLGGAERITVMWCQWLVEMGHQVQLFIGQPDEREFFSPPASVQILRRPAGLPSSLWLRRLLRENPPDLCIGVTTRPSINLLLASVGCPWPVVVAERNYPPSRPQPLIWALLRRLLYPTAALHLVQTQRIGRWLHQSRLASKSVVLPNPVLWPLPFQEPIVRPEQCITADARVVLAMGTKPFQKGFDRLLLAFQDLAMRHPDLVLALVGVSPDHPELAPQLQRMGPLRERIVLPSRVGNPADWYQRADLFVLSSRFEGSPNVLLEAMASGCPCLAVDCPTGPREVIDDGENGWLLPQQSDWCDLSAKIETCLNQPGECRRVGRNALAIRDLLSPASIQSAFKQSLESLLQPRVLVFLPTRRSPTETFVRANLARMPLEQTIYVGDEFGGWNRPGQLAYGLAILLSKFLTRLGWQRLASWPAACVAFVLIRLNRTDVVLAEFGFHAVRVMNACAWTNVPLVVHFRGSDASAHRRLTLLRERYRRLMHLSSALLAKSRAMKSVLVDLGADPAAVTITPSGADETLFLGGDPSSQPPHILFVGRLIEKKGPLDALEAFAQARSLVSEQLRAEMRLRIVGDGPLQTAVQSRVHDLGLQECVDFLGVQPPPAVADWMARSRCLLLPSRTASDGDAEGCPVAVLEAQLSGLPVVSTWHAGIPEVIENHKTGLLLDEGDVAGLASALALMCRDPRRAQQLGSAGRARVMTHFTVEHHVKTVADVLLQVASRRRCSAN